MVHGDLVERKDDADLRNHAVVLKASSSVLDDRSDTVGSKTVVDCMCDCRRLGDKKLVEMEAEEEAEVDVLDREEAKVLSLDEVLEQFDDDLADEDRGGDSYPSLALEAAFFAPVRLPFPSFSTSLQLQLDTLLLVRYGSDISPQDRRHVQCWLSMDCRFVLHSDLRLHQHQALRVPHAMPGPPFPPPA